MKKIFTILSCCILTAGALHAQKAPRYLVEVAVGAAVPTGRFADKVHSNIYNEKPSGIAKTGIAANASLGYYITKRVGVLLTAGYSVNGRAEAPYSDYYSKWYTNTERTDVDLAHWKQWRFMGGGFLDIPLTSGLSVVTKISAGFCKTALPGTTWATYGANNMALAWGREDDIQLPATFCYQAGMGFQYKLSRHFRVLLDANYFSTTPRKDYTYSLSANIMNPGPYITERKHYKLTTVNVLAGVGFSF